MRTRRRRRRISGPRLARILACAVVALLVAWWAVRMAAVEAFARRNPFAAAAVAPHDPRVVLSLATVEFLVRNGRVSPESRAATRRALGGSALAEEPFLLAGVQAIADGKPALGEKLLEESRRRNPRSRMTRLLLLDRYIRENRSAEAGAEVAALRRLNSEISAALASGLAGMARDPKTAVTTKRLLQRDPEMRDAVLAQLARSGADADVLLGFAGSGASVRGAEWQQILVQTLVGKGDFERGYAFWSRFYGVPASGAGKGLYDADFAGLPGSAPFNWQLVAGGEGVAERASGGALQVDYFGRGPAMLARQLLMLRPGRYRLALRAEGDAKGDGTRLSWNVACASGGAPLLHLPLTDIGSAPRGLAGAFAVPAGCTAQWLSLDGTPGDVAAEQIVRVSGLRIGEAGR